MAIGLTRIVVVGAAAAQRLFESSPQVVLAMARDMAHIIRVHTDMARGAARQTVNKTLRRLVADGFVRVESRGRAITVQDRDGLAAVARILM